MGNNGQAITEYILLLVIVSSFFLIALNGLNRLGLMARITAPLKDAFAKTYQYGHPKTKGFDDGGPDNHPRATGGNNFRMFISPEFK